MPDYEAMSGAEFQRAVGDDPAKWTEAAAQNAEAQGIKVEREWLLIWFTDAMDAARKGSIKETVG
jgi:hypothetical protein